MSLPLVLATADPRVIRPRDLTDVYAQPAKELGRLARQGVLLHLAHGYYAVVPEEFRGTSWRPGVEEVGLAVAQRDYGRQDVALMGISAARLVGALPRALGTAIVAVPRQRPVLKTRAETIRFVTRTVSKLDVQRVETSFATGWMTTPEQTLLDIADRSELGDLPMPEVLAAIERLRTTADLALVDELGSAQRKRAAAAVVRGGQRAESD